MSMREELHTRNEHNILLEVQHPFIINLRGTLQDTTNIYMVMDFVPGGELFALLQKSQVSRPTEPVRSRRLCVLIVNVRASRIPSPNFTPLKSCLHSSTSTRKISSIEI